MSRVHPAQVLYRQVIQRLVAAGVQAPQLEAQLLLGLAIGLPRVVILRGDDIQPNQQQARELERLVSERERRVPLAYLGGMQEFYGLTFEVTPAVLIPRPETELLVELAIRHLSGRPGPLIVDAGSGSGCIGISAAVHLPHARGVGVDLSEVALAIARKNAVRNGVADRVTYVRGDMLDPIAGGSVDLVVSNPPYIPTAELPGLQPEVRDYEPRMALDGGEDGFDFHRRLLTQAKRVLKPRGIIGIEVADGQALRLASLFHQAGFAEVNIHRDLAGIERVVEARFGPR